MVTPATLPTVSQERRSDRLPHTYLLSMLRTDRSAVCSVTRTSAFSVLFATPMGDRLSRGGVRGSRIIGQPIDIG